jgi:acyl carrier protein
MGTSSSDILRHVRELLVRLARDWDYPDDVGAETRFFADLQFESLDLVVFGTSVQDYYGRELPFAQLFASIGESGSRDITVGEMVAFIQRHLAASNAGASYQTKHA